MSIIDTHAHIYDPNIYKDADNLIQDLRQNNIKHVFLPATKLEDDQFIKELTSKDKTIFRGMIGIHPCDVTNDYNKNLKIIENSLSNYDYIAIGEIGLDYYSDKSNIEDQKKFLNEILDIAIKAKLPVSIHCREAFEDTYKILKTKKNLTGVIHCFTGTIEEANKYIDIGFKLGIGGILTFKNSKLTDTLKNINVTNIVLETDSPYLSPEPIRGTINTPSNLIYVIKKLTEIYNMQQSQLEDIINNNVKNIFKIK